MAVTFACSFHNKHVGELIQVLGRDLTLECASEFCRTYTPEWQPGGYERMMAARTLAEQTARPRRSWGSRRRPRPSPRTTASTRAS